MRHVPFEPLTGEELKFRRDQLGFTQEQMAHRLGVSRVTWNRWENDVQPVPNPVLLRLALATLKRRAKVKEIDPNAPPRRGPGRPRKIVE
jgi:transcriptional regulator with XRE-family HTH domain